MKIIVNGEEVLLDDDDRCTVRQLLERRGRGAVACAVEVNRQLVPKRQHETHRLIEGDQVEIVTLVGGG